MRRYPLELVRGLDLRRRPEVGRSPLRAWDAADERLVADVERFGPRASIVIVNDAFGALACALAAHHPVSLTDSVTSERASQENLERNGLDDRVRFATTTDELPIDVRSVDVVVIKVPKVGSLLEHQLAMLRPHLGVTTAVVGAGMVKHIHRSTLDIFERCVGPTITSRAEKKARLIFSTVDPASADVAPPADAFYDVDVDLGRSANAGSLRVIGRPGVFSRHNLDPGARLLLEELPSILDRAPGHSVVDLGCGNGVLGASVLRANSDRTDARTVHFVDESHLAVASAIVTAGGDPHASFATSDTLEHLETGSVDLVLCNPPFHQGHAQTDRIAEQMFADARRVLGSGGHLIVVANRHLGHHVRLSRLFGRPPETIGSTPRFVLLRSVAS